MATLHIPYPFFTAITGYLGSLPKTAHSDISPLVEFLKQREFKTSEAGPIAAITFKDNDGELRKLFTRLMTEISATFARLAVDARV